MAKRYDGGSSERVDRPKTEQEIGKRGIMNIVCRFGRCDHDECDPERKEKHQVTLAEAEKRGEMYANLASPNSYGKWVESMWFSHPHADGVLRELGDRDLAIMGLGLGGEMGEVFEKCAIAVGKVQEKIKKELRDGTPDPEGVKKELGDVWFYSTMIARYYGFSPSDVMEASYEKLTGRRERGTERGSGDNR